MNKMRNWMLGLTLVSLLAIGVAALAGNGLGATTDWNPPHATGDCDSQARDADNDGTSNCDDGDWARALNGGGYGEGGGYGHNLFENRPLDGEGFGAGQGVGGMRQGGK